MTGQTIFYLGLGAVAGGFINGLAGTGTALFALGFYLVVLDPVTAVAIVAVMSIVAGVQGLWMVRSEIWSEPSRLLRFLVPGLIGVPIGILLLGMIDARVLRLSVAGLLVTYGAYFLLRRSLPAFSRRTPLLDSLVGLIGGVLGGAASVSGAVPSMWLSLRPWTKSQIRAVLQPYNMATLCMTVSLLFLSGAYDWTALQALAVTVPVGLVAAQAGIMTFHAISDRVFRLLLIGLTLLMGLGILMSALL